MCWKRTPHKSLLLSEGGTTNDVWHLVANSVGQEGLQKLDENKSQNNNVCFILFRLRPPRFIDRDRTTLISVPQTNGYEDVGSETCAA